MTPSDREPAGQRIARARRRRGLSQAVLRVHAEVPAVEQGVDIGPQQQPVVEPVLPAPVGECRAR